MPLFCIIGLDAKDSKLKREKFLEPHLEALKKMNLAGRLFAAGPLMTSTDEGAQYCGSMQLSSSIAKSKQKLGFNKNPYLDALHLCQ